MENSKIALIGGFGIVMALSLVLIIFQ